MSYDEIMVVLSTIENILHDYNYPYYKHEEAADALVELHNTYCNACNLQDDYIMQNTEEELELLLPVDPLQAFYDGRASSNNYSPNDTWITLNGYMHIVSCTNSMLIDKFIYLSDIARWLEDKEEEEQERLLEELTELASDYNEEKED